MKIDIYNQQGEKTGTTLLPKEIFDVKMSPDLVHQVVVSQMANRRQISAHTKDRGEVRGGGRKPWRQKGTGRARHGSRRSPIWRGGGVVFGPTKDKVLKKTIPGKMRKKALFMVLSQKVRDGELRVLDELKLEKPKTKEMAKVIENQKSKTKDQKHKPKIKKGKGESFLIALPRMDENLILAARNIPQTATIQAKDLNCLDVLSYKYLIAPKEAINTIKTTFLKSEIRNPKSEKSNPPGRTELRSVQPKS